MTEMEVDNSKSQESIEKNISVSITLLQKAVSTLEPRFATRALRGTSSYRHFLSKEIIENSISTYVNEPTLKSLLLESVNGTAKTTKHVATVPENEIFVGYLVIFYHLDVKNYEKGALAALALIEKCKKLNRRTLDPLLARLYFFYAHFSELLGKLSEIQEYIILAHRTATLRQDNDTHATLTNIILRSYLSRNLIDQADKFVAKSNFPVSAGNNQLARYMYYLGRIKAIQLEYSASYGNLLQAIRKAPQTAVTSGFQQVAHKLCIIVQLLMGEIPDRFLFHQQGLQTALVPYLQITQAVRTGDLGKFQEALANFEDVFHQDGNMNLILRHNVIKTGIRRISISYSRISLKDICLKLQLDSEEDAEYIVAKAIRDGVIDATIEHEQGYMKSNEVLDVYSTNEPMQTFHQRINFCLDLHNESVQALRFPHGAHKKELEQVAEKLEEERELTKTILEEGLEEDDDMGGF